MASGSHPCCLRKFSIHGDSRLSSAASSKRSRPKTNDGNLSSNLHVDIARKVFNWKLFYIKCELRSDDGAAVGSLRLLRRERQTVPCWQNGFWRCPWRVSKPDFSSRVSQCSARKLLILRIRDWSGRKCRVEQNNSIIVSISRHVNVVDTNFTRAAFRCGVERVSSSTLHSLLDWHSHSIIAASHANFPAAWPLLGG